MIKILLDTSCDMPQALRDKYGIRWVHFPINFDTENFYDQKDLGIKEFFQKIADTGITPKTSQVTQAQFEEAIGEMLVDEGDHVLVITLSSTLSGTYNEAVKAQETFGADKVTVVDSKLATIMIGDLAITAAEMIQGGKSIQEIVAVLDEMKSKREAVFMLDTLDFLRKGGRISFAQSVVGGLLNIKVILKYTDGKIVPFEKAKGKKQGMRIVLDWVKANHVEGSRILIAHAINPEGAEEMKALIQDELGLEVAAIGEIGAVIGTHVGPGTLAVSC